jgi:protein-L-isoaspartate(D-aspartate) O-methyltransferase
VSSAVERLIGVTDSDEALGQFLLALRTRGLRDARLLEALERAPRAEFVAPEHVGFAYRDISLPLPCGQETGRPLAVIAAVQALELSPRSRVLEVGTGSGWQTALIAGMAGAVASVERWAGLADLADQRLSHLGIANAVVAHADGLEGLASAAPFDRIILNGSVAEIPHALFDQLAPDGFILAPVSDAEGVRFERQRLRRGRVEREALSIAACAPLLPCLADGS